MNFFRNIRHQWHDQTKINYRPLRELYSPNDHDYDPIIDFILTFNYEDYVVDFFQKVKKLAN